MNATLRRSRVLVVVSRTRGPARRVRQQQQVRFERHHDRRRRRRTVSATLNGAGSSFQKTFNEAAIAGFHEAERQDHDHLRPGRFRRGQDRAADQDRRLRRAPTASRSPTTSPKYQGGTVLYFPTVAAPITVSYNLTGVEKLQLSGTTLAKIFSLKIKKWNDAAIAADNPGVTLPSTAITVVHRSDGSGTTSNFTKFLTAVDPTDWTLGSGDTVDWTSLGTTQGGEKNSGVAQIVKSTEGAVGYVDLADATRPSCRPRRSRTRTASSSRRPSKARRPRSPARRSTTTCRTTRSTPPGADAYPITSPTWIIAYEKQTSHDNGHRAEGVPHVHLRPGPGAGADRRVRGAARLARCRRPSPSSTSSRSRS